MPELMVSQLFVALAAAFSGCFAAPRSEIVGRIVAGWMQCFGRWGITGVALAAGSRPLRRTVFPA